MNPFTLNDARLLAPMYSSISWSNAFAICFLKGTAFLKLFVRLAFSVFLCLV